MQRTEISNLCQSLRGSQAVVVLAFLLLRTALSVEDLVEVTGIDPDTVRKSVKGLAAKGNLVKQVGPHGRTLWLPVGQTLFALADQGAGPVDVEPRQSPKTSDSGALRSSSSPSLPASLPIVNQEEEESAESENFGLCLQACDDCGIREPKKTRLAGLRHVTPEIIRGHVAQGRAQGVPLGTVIYRIENDWLVEPKYMDIKTDAVDPAKEAAAFTGHKLNCKCVDCSIIRSLNGSTELMCPDCGHYHCECGE